MYSSTDMIITSVQYSPTGDELVIGLDSGRILVHRATTSIPKIHHILDFAIYEVVFILNQNFVQRKNEDPFSLHSPIHEPMGEYP